MLGGAARSTCRGSIGDNITFGLSASPSEIQSAVELRRAHGIHRHLAGRPGCEAGLPGANLPGGQRQRIGLARALVRHPDVLILDEATSALDRQTRDIVLGNLRREFRDRILIFITHDSHVIKLADEVWHISKGKLVVEAHETAV